MIKFVNLIAITAAATAAAAEKVPVYYLIRHAEKNTDGTISIQGQQREQCLVKLFGKSSKYNIQHIMVQTPYPGGSSRFSVFETLMRMLTMSLPQRFCRRPHHPASIQHHSAPGRVTRHHY